MEVSKWERASAAGEHWELRRWIPADDYCNDLARQQHQHRRAPHTPARDMSAAGKRSSAVLAGLRRKSALVSHRRHARRDGGGLARVCWERNLRHEVHHPHTPPAGDHSKAKSAGGPGARRPA